MENQRVIELALEGLKRKRDAIEAEIAELNARMRGVGPAGEQRQAPVKAKGPATVAARRRQSERMKAYWAARRRAKSGPSKEPAARKSARRIMSAAAKKAISKKMKAAWAKRKADAAKTAK
jgi:hypothetical protein